MLIGIALALTAVRRLINAAVSWTDLLDLKGYAWLVKYMSAPTIAVWISAWNRWSARPSLIIDAVAVALALLGLLGAAADAPLLVAGARLASLGLLIVVGMRIARLLALFAFTTVVAALFGGELLDPIGVPGIWFPFGIGVSRTQYTWAFGIPLIAFLVVQTVADPEKSYAGKV